MTRPTLALGYDAVVPIDPATYDVTQDADGVAYTFDLGAEREHVVEAVRASFDNPRAVQAVTVEPGYIRVKVVPDRDGPGPKAVREHLRAAARTYNDRHATAEALDGLTLLHDYHIGTYRPEDAPTRERALGDLEHAAAPESDGPVFEYRRDDAGEVALQDTRRFAYRFTFRFDAAEMYGTADTTLATDTRPVIWNDDVRKALRVAVEDLPAWPGSAENLPRVAVYPTHAVVECYTAAFTPPTRLATKAGTGLLRYNQYRNEDDRRANGHAES